VVEFLVLKFNFQNKNVFSKECSWNGFYLDYETFLHSFSKPRKNIRKIDLALKKKTVAIFDNIELVFESAIKITMHSMFKTEKLKKDERD